MSTNTIGLFTGKDYVRIIVTCALPLCVLVGVFYRIHNVTFFTWMDPYQYYHASLQWMDGRLSLLDFDVPSVFPVFLGVWQTAFGPGMVQALSFHGVSMIVMVLGIYRCARLAYDDAYVGILANIFFFAMPAVWGLAGELYIELTLGALITFWISVWIADTGPGPAKAWMFAVVSLTATLFLLKTTAGLFVIGPVCLSIAVFSHSRRDRIRRLTALSLAAVLYGIYIVKLGPSAIRYILTGGNTHLDVMSLIGPGQIFSADSVFYYPFQIGRNYFFLLTPFLLFAFHRSNFSGRKLFFWAWILPAIIVLFFIPVKAARHILPAMPALCLLAAGGAIRVVRGSGRMLRGVAASIGVPALVCQSFFIWSASPVFSFPHLSRNYFDPEQFGSVIQQCAPPDQTEKNRDARISKSKLSYVFVTRDRNLLSAVCYFLRPGLVFIPRNDFAGQSPIPSIRDSETPKVRFFSPWYYASLGAYNLQNNYRRYFHLFDDEVLIEHVDVILVHLVDGSGADRMNSRIAEMGFTAAGEVPLSSGRILVFKREPKRADEPLWIRYVGGFLSDSEKHAELSRAHALDDYILAASVYGHDRAADQASRMLDDIVRRNPSFMPQPSFLSDFFELRRRFKLTGPDLGQ